MPELSRRDFLRISSLAAGTVLAEQLVPGLRSSGSAASAGRPNILIFVFDAMSASNLSLYGYHRRTTPNLERLASRATVYHQHYAAGNFTTPGTASLLTGLYPWTHRAINLGGLIARKFAKENLFRALGDRYQRVAFAQNLWANYLLGQFQRDIERTLSPAAFSMIPDTVGERFGADRVDSQRAFEGFMLDDGHPPAALILGLAQGLQLFSEAQQHAISPEYPGGMPRTFNNDVFFKLSDVFRGLAETIGGLAGPALAYFHLYAPHEPYIPTREFEGLFLDGWDPEPKPNHRLADRLNPRSVSFLNESRLAYDRYITNLDAEFGRLLDALEARGILETSYVVVTADHGELLERGYQGHSTPLLYEPLVRVPLLISAPAQQARRDVHAPTSCVDLLPTLVHLSDAELPAWCEGQILPGFGGPESNERPIFMMEAKTNSAYAPLSVASFAMRKGRFKVSYFRGHREYKGLDKFELYDLEDDPEERNDLYGGRKAFAQELRDELVARVNTENAKLEAG